MIIRIVIPTTIDNETYKRILEATEEAGMYWWNKSGVGSQNPVAKIIGGSLECENPVSYTGVTIELSSSTLENREEVRDRAVRAVHELTDIIFNSEKPRT